MLQDFLRSTVAMHPATAFVPLNSGSKQVFRQPSVLRTSQSPIDSFHHPRACSDDTSRSRRRRRPSRKPSAFENTIDDLTMKRLGRGSIYYGERPDVSESEELPVPGDFLKPDPILVTGATGRTGQWIALGLLNQEFNVRCFTRNFDRAEAIFGPSGSNLDVFQGDLASFEDVYDAVEGSVAIVCASGAPWWLPGGFANVDVKGVHHLVEAAKKTGTVDRFVLISAADKRGSRAKAKREAEQIVLQSGLPYTIFRSADLSEAEGGLREIVLSVDDASVGGIGELSRVDLAQSVCQSLVYGRSVAQLRTEDPEGEFDFPSCIIRVENGPNPYVPDKRFWKKELNRICDSQIEKTNPAGEKVDHTAATDMRKLSAP